MSNTRIFVDISEKEIHDIRNFVRQLNSSRPNPVIVEGKRDSNALKKLGYLGTILEFHKFRGVNKFVDSVAKYEKLILLLDGDRKGRYLTAKLVEKLQHRTKIDLTFKKKLVKITKGKIRFIEQLSRYESLI